MLQPQAHLVPVAVAEANARGDVVAELEVRAEEPLGVDVQVREEVEADRRLEEGPDARARAALQAEHRRDADVPHVLPGAPGAQRPAPAADLEVPVAAERPGVLLEPAAVPVPVHAEAYGLGVLVAEADLERAAVDGVRAGRRCHERGRAEGFPYH